MCTSKISTNVFTVKWQFSNRYNICIFMSSIAFYRYIDSVLIFFQAEHLGQNQFPFIYPTSTSSTTLDHLLTRESESDKYKEVLERVKWWNDHFKGLFSKQGFFWESASPSLSQKMFSHITCTGDSDMDTSKLQPRLILNQLLLSFKTSHLPGEWRPLQVARLSYIN